MEKRDRARGGLPYLMALFRPGERHLVKGKLFFGEDRKSLEFEKEFVVPRDKKISDAEASVPAHFTWRNAIAGGATSILARADETRAFNPAKLLAYFNFPEAPTETPEEPPDSEDTAGNTTCRRKPAGKGAVVRHVASFSGGSISHRRRWEGSHSSIDSGQSSRRVVRRTDSSRRRPGIQVVHRNLAGRFQTRCPQAVFHSRYSNAHRPKPTALKCSDWPVWNRGKKLGTKTLSETWTRQQ